MVIQTAKTSLMKIAASCLVAVFGLTTLIAVTPVSFAGNGGGFDEFGYNRGARIFNGTGGSYAMAGGKLASSMGVYQNDKLVMKWNAAWDACNAANKLGTNNASTCAGATLSNEWNGNVPGGSGESEHLKVVWSQTCWAKQSLTDGGSCIWGQYEVIMDHGIIGGVHEFWTKASPSGFGQAK